jgi:hypothetical protein
MDRFIVVEQLFTEDTTRILYETPYAAGKGISVSRVIRELGGMALPLGSSAVMKVYCWKDCLSMRLVGVVNHRF